MLLLLPENRVLIADMGLSAWLQPEQEQHIPISTLNYQCPESRLDRKFGTAGDMWSLGCSLLQLATGRMPFAGEEQSMDELLSLGVIPLPKVPVTGPNYPPKLAELVDNLLQREPEKRLSAIQVIELLPKALLEIAFGSDQGPNIELPPSPVNVIKLAHDLLLSSSALALLDVCVNELNSMMPLERAGRLLALLSTQSETHEAFWGTLHPRHASAMLANVGDKRFIITVSDDFSHFVALVSPDAAPHPLPKAPTLAASLAECSHSLAQYVPLKLSR